MNTQHIGAFCRAVSQFVIFQEVDELNRIYLKYWKVAIDATGTIEQRHKLYRQEYYAYTQKAEELLKARIRCHGDVVSITKLVDGTSVYLLPSEVDLRVAYLDYIKASKQGIAVAD